MNCLIFSKDNTEGLLLKERSKKRQKEMPFHLPLFF
ncbi:hypothetical protein P872_07830 [Rhodonellum psychrophilum GCM71 = DSM 17998]|uniref:Uncharacterized protein n=1 Tax=Rhodonellum psychrophilum GCM71 = DSM 17998 TaxID=1123057 RepID=U5BYV3_9BACT|nr:hypothetical protein P872_07830 [Rhodonellum psychrophilum GCM71 = DSM 17998]